MKECCENCGSLDVEQEAWVNINTLKYTGSLDQPTFYCNNCEQSTSICTTEEYKELQNEK